MKNESRQYERDVTVSSQKVSAKRIGKRKPTAPRTQDEQDLIDACLNLACSLNWRRAARGYPNKPATIQNETALLKEVSNGLLMAIQARFW